MLSACKDYKSSPMFRVLTYKYLGPNDHRGSRVQIRDKKLSQSIKIPFDHGYPSTEAQVWDWLAHRGWPLAGINVENGVIVVAPGAFIAGTSRPLTLREERTT